VRSTSGLAQNFIDWLPSAAGSTGQRNTKKRQPYLFSKRDLSSLFEKIKPDKNMSPQLTLALARR
jgi:hypothetical protein